ncbi:MAG: serine/threonine-protein kinase [Planctomycetota bacterium]
MSGALFWSLGEAMRGFGAPEVEVRMAELGPGDSLEGGYRVLELLGEGAYGRVYRALDPQLGREVAVKVLTAGGPARERRFLREGRIAAALDHPSIGRVFSVGEHGTHPFLVYELLEGARDLRAAAPHWSRGQRLQALLQVADGVGHAHARGFVHRDLKPDNVVVDAGGRCRVIDFGLARDESDDGERLTASGALVGTPLYMAPEGFEQKHLGPAADVWSLGVILYWLLTDAHPFQAGSLLELGRRVTELDPTPPRELDASIPPALQAVCQRALERELDARYPDARAFAQALREALGEAPRSPAPGGAPRWPWALVGVAVLVAVAAFFGGGGPTPRTPTLEGAAAVEAALLAGEAERAHVLLDELPPSPERALLAARVARARGADPRPGLGAALRRWERPSLGLALARAELEAGDDLAARRALGGELERWPGDPEARALRGLLERLGEPRFDADRVELWREHAPRAVNAWLEVGCRRDLELWRWRRDPRQSERGQSTFEPEADLRERLKALARWADAPATLGFARGAGVDGGPRRPPPSAPASSCAAGARRGPSRPGAPTTRCR